MPQFRAQPTRWRRPLVFGALILLCVCSMAPMGRTRAGASPFSSTLARVHPSSASVYTPQSESRTLLPLVANPPEWSIQQVDAAGGPNALVLDSHNTPHLSYLALSQGVLKYAILASKTWQIQPVDQIDTQLLVTPVLRLDAQNRPHIVYRGVDGIWYATWTGAVWAKERALADPARTITAVDFALDSDGQPHLAYAEGFRQLYYRYHSHGTWVSEPVVTDPIGVGDVALALDHLDRPHIAYGKDVHYARRLDTTWDIELVADQPTTIVDVALVLYQNDTPLIGFNMLDRFGNRLYLTRKAGATWPVQGIASLVLGFSLALDGVATPHVLYYEDIGNPGGGTGELHYMQWTGYGARRPMVDRPGTVQPFLALALDPTGRAHVSYAARPDGLRYAVRTRP